jgi:DNA-binding transcriptional LysR family regulator
VGDWDARGPWEDLAELHELAVEGGVVVRREREFDRPRGGLGWGLGPAHVIEPRAGGVGVDEARAERHEQLVVGEVAAAALEGGGADGSDLRDLGWDVQPFSEAFVSRTAVVDGLPPLGDEGVDGIESALGGAGKALGHAVVELVERAERAGDDDQPAGRAQAGREGAQHAGGREVAGPGDGVDLVDRIGVGAHARGGVGEHDVDLAELGGECGDGGGVAHVEHAALDVGDRRPLGDGRGRRPDTGGVAPGEQAAVVGRHAGGQPLDQCTAEPLIGAGDKSDAGRGHTNNVAAAEHAQAENDAQVPCTRRMPTDVSHTGLRILREIAQAGSFSAAAHSLGYTQSAVSRQVAALETASGRRLFDRSRHGVALTPAGTRLLATAVRVLDELDGTLRELSGDEVAAAPVRLGAFATAAAGLVPRALAALAPPLKVTLREGTTPALTRALRAGSLDLAVIARTPPFRPPDAESPALELTTLSERELVIGVSTRHPFATARAIEVQQLAGQIWVASRSGPGDTLLGVWPGLAERPDVRYVVRDWLAKLQIVSAGLAITTLAPTIREVLPDGVKAVAVRGEPQETRRIVLARRPGPLDGAPARVADALIVAAAA